MISVLCRQVGSVGNQELLIKKYKYPKIWWDREEKDLTDHTCIECTIQAIMVVCTSVV
jgi:hypothetical protein